MLFEMVYVANQTTGLGIDPFTYHTNSSGSLLTAIEWVAPFCAGQAPWPIGQETPTFAPFVYKMYHFTKIGSGQT
jgi:hypothetical protein